MDRRDPPEAAQARADAAAQQLNEAIEYVLFWYRSESTCLNVRYYGTRWDTVIEVMREWKGYCWERNLALNGRGTVLKQVNPLSFLEVSKFLVLCDSSERQFCFLAHATIALNVDEADSD